MLRQSVAIFSVASTSVAEFHGSLPLNGKPGKMQKKEKIDFAQIFV